MTMQAGGTDPQVHGNHGNGMHGHTALAHPEHPERFTGHPSLPEHLRRDVGGSLQATLVELLDLSLIAKQLHWTLVGPGSGSLRAMFAEFSAEWIELADTVAERAVAIGVMPDGQALTIAGRRDEHLIAVEPLSCVGATRELTTHLSAAVVELRTRIDRTSEQDLVSQDVLLEVARAVEHHLWQVRAHGG